MLKSREHAAEVDGINVWRYLLQGMGSGHASRKLAAAVFSLGLCSGKQIYTTSRMSSGGLNNSMAQCATLSRQVM